MSRIFNFIPLKIKLAIVVILGFTVCIAMLLYFSLSKLTDLYNKTYQTNLYGSLASARFLLENFQDDLDQSATRVAGQQIFLDTFKEEDPELLAVVLEDLMASEPLDLGYIAWIKDEVPFLWTRSHNLNVITSKQQEAIDQVIWRHVKEGVLNPLNDQHYYQGYLALNQQFLNLDFPSRQVSEDQLVYVVAVPIIVWNELRGLAIFGTIIQHSVALKERLSKILGISFDNSVAFQLRFQQRDYLKVAHPNLYAKLSQNVHDTQLDRVQDQLEPYPIEILLYSDRYRLTQEIQNKVFFILFFIGMISFVFVTVLLIFLSKILGSLEDLVATSNLMKKGVYSARMSVKSEDELGMLANHFNEMAKSIEEKVQTINEQSHREKLLRKLQHEAELSHLKNQMKPHFLFNSLHMIASLIEIDRDVATEATYLLADLYRLILQSSKAPTSTLKCELDILENYLEIQRMRFGERLKYRIHVDLPIVSIYVPHLVLQTLVENAVKHGIEKSLDGGDIIIKVFQLDKKLYEAQVINTGTMIERDMIEKTGLRNTRLMLKHLYGKKACLKFDTSRPGLVTASFMFSGEKL
ncbi:MAG: sensor histidine kinase [Oligoflexus sp.]